jgi:hypothetical protein
MVTDADGQTAEGIQVPNRASQGTTGGRTMPRPPEVSAALVTWQTWREDVAGPERPGRVWVHRRSPSLTMDRSSSHAGRRTCIPRAARTVSQVGGSLGDVQARAGQTTLAMPQRTIEGETDTTRQRVVLMEGDGWARATRAHPTTVAA